MFFFQIFGWFELLQWSLACLLVSLISFYSLYIPDNVNLAIFRYFLNYFVVIYFLRLWNTPARWNFIFLLRIICCFTFFFNILCLKELSSQDCFILGKIVTEQCILIHIITSESLSSQMNQHFIKEKLIEKNVLLLASSFFMHLLRVPHFTMLQINIESLFNI